MPLFRLLLILTLFTFCAGSSQALPPAGHVVRADTHSAQVIDNQSYIDANRVLGFVSNTGNLFYDAGMRFGKNDGLYFPYVNTDYIQSGLLDNTVIFDAGLWLGGKVNGQIRVTVAEYSSEYYPGPMINGTFDPTGLTNWNFRNFKIHDDSLSGNPNEDYLGWPDAQGAPTGANGAPVCIGDQTLYSVFSDADASRHFNDAGSSQPLGVEVRQTVMAWRDSAVVDTVITPSAYFPEFRTPSTYSLLLQVVDPNAITGHQYMVEIYPSGTERMWRFVDVTSSQIKLNDMALPGGAAFYPLIDGMSIRIADTSATGQFERFQATANAAGPINPPVTAALASAGFPTPLDQFGNPTNPNASQQVSGQPWLIHTADNGGSGGGGTRGSFASFVSRVTRDGGNRDQFYGRDFEIRFTGNPANPGVGGSYALEAFADGNLFWVPYELWCLGTQSRNDPSDDYQMISFTMDDGEDNTFNLESWGSPTLGGGYYEHSVSTGIDDPYTDWVYLYHPEDRTPGSSGYQTTLAQMQAGTYVGLNDKEALARLVFVAWNAGEQPPFTVPMIEQGTVFQILTKYDLSYDTALFVATVPTINYTNNGGSSIVVRYDMFNKGQNQITDMYVGFWADPDVGNSGDDLVGCDTASGAFFAYNDGDDTEYGLNPPAAGLRLLQGPIIASPGDTAVAFGIRRSGFKNIPVHAFTKFINGTDPGSPIQSYYYMQGLQRDGTPYTVNGNAVRYFVSGNPLLQTGDVDVSPADRRMLTSVGPITFSPGDSQQVIVKWSVGQGTSALTSINALKTELSAGARIALEPSSLDFVAGAGEGLPDVQALLSHAVGIGLTDWTATSSESWLTVSAVDIPGTPDTIKVQPNTTSLTDGTYSATVVVTGSRVLNGPIRIPVTYTVVGSGCCEGTTGNVNYAGNVDLSDLSLLIGYLTMTPRPTLVCNHEANINKTGTIDLSDLSLLIAYLTQTPRPSLPDCPTGIAADHGGLAK